MDNQVTDQNTVNEIYDYAANLMVNEGKNAEETRQALIEYGVSQEGASIVVTNLKQQIKEEKRKGASKDMLYGVLWAIGGLIATGLTYNAAEDGGEFIAFYGAVIYGGYRFLKGLFSSIFYSV